MVPDRAMLFSISTTSLKRLHIFMYIKFNDKNKIKTLNFTLLILRWAIIRNVVILPHTHTHTHTHTYIYIYIYRIILITAGLNSFFHFLNWLSNQVLKNQSTLLFNHSFKGRREEFMFSQGHSHKMKRKDPRLEFKVELQIPFPTIKIVILSVLSFFIYMYIYMHTHTHTYTHTYTHVSLFLCVLSFRSYNTHTSIQINTHTCTHTYTHKHTHARTYDQMMIWWTFRRES